MLNKDLLKHEKKILELRDKIKEQGRNGKRNLEKEWFRNILFLVGNQWIVWNKSKRTWEEPKDLDQWIERPVTNKFASAYKTIKSLYVNRKPRTIVKPSSESEEDVATAKVGDALVDVLEVETGRKKARSIAAGWFTATGNCFKHSYPVVDEKFGNVFIPFEMCEACQAVVPPDQIEQDTCPKCQTKGQFVPAIGLDGKEIGAQKPKGKLCCDAPSPFEMFFDQEVEKWEDVKQVIRSKIKSIDEIKEMFPDFAEKISPDTTLSGQSEMLIRSLSYMANTGEITASNGTGTGKSEKGVIDYMYVLPTQMFPNGLMATIVSEVIVEVDTMDFFTDKDGVHYMPIDHCGADGVPGRLWGKTVMDDVAVKQLARNKLESFILTFIYALSGGKYLEPDGCNMDQPTGEPNQVLRYTAGPGGSKPEKMEGMAPNGILLQLIQQYDTEIEALAHTYDVMNGQKPAGVDTYSGLALLEEKATSGHSDPLSNWEAFDETHTKKQIEMARKFWVEPRKKTYENEMGSYETQEFTKADIQGGLDIQVEPGSTTPKSKAIENATILDLTKQGIVNAQDPKVNYKILEKLGQTELASGISEDIRDAAKEWNDFYNAVMENPDNPEMWVTRPRVGIDNEQIHLMDATSRAKSDKFWELPPQAQQIWVEHLGIHKANFDRQMAQQAEMQQGPQNPKKEVAA